MAIGPGGTTRRSCSARLARPAPHAVLDTADQALVHPNNSGKVPHPLAPRQGRSDLADLIVKNLGGRVVISPHMSPVPQAVRRAAVPITRVKVFRPVVFHVIISVADELVAAEQPAQDYRHNRAMQHDPAFSYLSI